MFVREIKPSPHVRSVADGRRRSLRGFAAGALVTASALAVLPAAQAAPAPEAATTEVSAPGPFSVAAPEGVCAVRITVAGGSGGDALGAGSQGGGAEVTIGPFPVSPGDLVEGTVGGRGANGGTAGVNGGGEGSPTGGHRGAGGGGYTEVSIDGGTRLALVGGGGGSGGGHVPEWGHGGDAGVPTGPGVFVGEDGLDGDDGAGNPRPGGGGGGQATEGGAGGVHPDDPGRSGAAGSALQGGSGGPEASLDGGGGGGGGLYGGGGGASTVLDSVGGAGGGGGSSHVAASVPVLSSGLNADGDGYANLDWEMCEYDLSLTKSSPVGVFENDVPVAFTVTVTNEGPEPMTVGDTVTITDPNADGATLTGVSHSGSGTFECDTEIGQAMGGSLTCGEPVGAGPGAPLRGLAVGESLTVTYTQAYDSAEPVTNTATVTDRGDQDNNQASVTLDPAQPSLELVKSASPETVTKAGDTISYEFAVTNTGNIALQDISIDEGAFSGTGDLGTAVCPEAPGGLQPGDTITCTLDYKATQADVDAGEVTNSATAEGTTPGGAVATSNESSAVVEAPAAPSIDLQKSSDTDRLRSAGQVVTYTFTLTNTGNVTVSDLEVVEGSFSGTGDLSPVVCPDIALAPGDDAECTATYRVTQADIDAEEGLTNTATATALGPDGQSVESDPSTAEIDGPSLLAGLPDAGSPEGMALLGGLGLALLAGGGTLVVATRRRRRVALA